MLNLFPGLKGVFLLYFATLINVSECVYAHECVVNLFTPFSSHYAQMLLFWDFVTADYALFWLIRL